MTRFCPIAGKLAVPTGICGDVFHGECGEGKVSLCCLIERQICQGWALEFLLFLLFIGSLVIEGHLYGEIFHNGTGFRLIPLSCLFIPQLLDCQRDILWDRFSKVGGAPIPLDCCNRDDQNESDDEEVEGPNGSLV